MISIEDVIRITIEAHEGQKDLDGKPEILHPLAVGLAGTNREEWIKRSMPTHFTTVIIHPIWGENRLKTA